MPKSPLSIQELTLGIELINDQAWMGGTIYLRNLVRCLYRLPSAERPKIQLLGDPQTVESLLAIVGGQYDSTIARSGSTFWRRLASLVSTHRFHRLIDRIRHRTPGGIDVLYPGFGTAPPGVAIMRWIPDFQHRHLPELFSEEERSARDASMTRVASQPGILILSSQAALQDFRHFFPDARSTPRVWSFHSLLELPHKEESLADSSPMELPSKYLYLPNQFWVHKNHLVLFKALAVLRDVHGLVIPVICTGSSADARAKSHYQSLLDMLHENGLHQQVWRLGLLPRDQQLSIFRRCTAVVQPSRFEGWSTVVEDARAIGRPIFLSDIAVHREQMPECPLFFDPSSPEQLARLIADHWSDLAPGPDPVAEASAQARSEVMILESARHFITYCQEADRLTRDDSTAVAGCSSP